MRETMAEELPEKSNFSEWYNEILKLTEIIDVRYPVKGLYTWFPFGLKIRNLVYDRLKELHNERGHDEVKFPLLIPKKRLMKEADHIASFEDEVFWVERAGKNKLEEPLALRPTSETAMYPIFNKWIRSHTDLPFKSYQVVNTFRYETKHTRPLIREREINSFKEAHTVHEDAKGAEKQIDEAIEIYKKFFDELCVPYLITKRPKWDKFPGAEYTIAFDTMMPDGKALQIGTIHNLGTNFSETFNISFENQKGKQEDAHQCCYGISARCIASLVSVHGDDTGLILPPKFAPIQVVIVPILFSDSDKDKIMGECKRIKDKLKDKDIRTKIDDSEERPGEKFYKWERKGIPLRIEIGPNDIKEDSMTLVRRDTNEKNQLGLDASATDIKEIFEEIKNSLKEKARQKMNSEIIKPKEIEDCKKAIKNNKLVKINWCGEKECGKEIEEQLKADILGSEISTEPKGKCIKCSKKAKNSAYIAKTY
ncbi:MAG: Prolyl-tRNA synthetase [Candidatus Methanohalarchaeum thermophilum]|uniref:Proline--tRNA ligase n=1 Tax=Methanohalarchaeum thermophilum TaxID=1903181 RepID=A0A1Q6DXS4_METT1|nr:MAG: Prolyl-tRNA synthetase [Candidatus Methanohalarchaeum thermophilum]